MARLEKKLLRSSLSRITCHHTELSRASSSSHLEKIPSVPPARKARAVKRTALLPTGGPGVRISFSLSVIIFYAFSERSCERAGPRSGGPAPAVRLLYHFLNI